VQENCHVSFLPKSLVLKCQKCLSGINTETTHGLELGFIPKKERKNEREEVGRLPAALFRQLPVLRDQQ
jgi:hypothetical protein